MTLLGLLVGGFLILGGYRQASDGRVNLGELFRHVCRQGGSVELMLIAEGCTSISNLALVVCIDDGSRRVLVKEAQDRNGW